MTDEQIAALNAQQHDCEFGCVHPYTCGNNSDHVLTATRDGWACPECDYRQPYRGETPMSKYLNERILK